MTDKKLIRNVVRCDTCMVVIESRFRHDFRTCDCPDGSGTEIFTDGGRDYIRRGWGVNARMTDLSEYEE